MVELTALLGISGKEAPAVQEMEVCSWGQKIPWRRQWQPTPVFLPGESQGQRSLVGYSPWSHKESDTTEQLSNKLLQHSFLLSPHPGIVFGGFGVLGALWVSGGSEIASAVLRINASILSGAVFQFAGEFFSSPFPAVTAFQFTRLVVSNSLQPHELQHTRLPCPSPTPRAYSNSWNRCCHPAISSSVSPFSHLQSFPASGSGSQFFASGGQSIEASASASVLPMTVQD